MTQVQKVKVTGHQVHSIHAAQSLFYHIFILFVMNSDFSVMLPLTKTCVMALSKGHKKLDIRFSLCDITFQPFILQFILMFAVYIVLLLVVQWYL